MRFPRTTAALLSLFLAVSAWPAELGPEFNAPEASAPLQTPLPPLNALPDLSAPAIPASVAAPGVFQTPLLLAAARAPQPAAAAPSSGLMATFTSPNPTASQQARVQNVISVFESSTLDHAAGGHVHGDPVAPGPGGGDHGNGLKAFKRGLAVAAVFVAAEAVGGAASHSMSLQADAIHSGLDIVINAVGMAAIVLARRHPEGGRWRRAEPAVGLASAALIAMTAFELGHEAFQRFLAPEPVSGLLVAAFSLCGIVAHFAPALALYSRRKEGVAVEGVFLHGATDALGSLAVGIGGALAWGLGWSWLDPAVGAAVALLVAHTSWELGRRSWKAFRAKKP